MSALPLISICVPAYKNAAFLNRLFQSIREQRFRDFEVVISDDSPDDEVFQLYHEYQHLFQIQYFKNKPSLGSPANWNFAIKNAKGSWIKIMHDDDWFTSSESLAVYHQHIQQFPKIRFFYAAYRNVPTGVGKPQVVRTGLFDRLLLHCSPLNLLRNNSIGNPSCTLIHRDAPLLYDEKMKWVVDIDYYIQVLQKNIPYKYIPQPLIDVGISQEQITVSCFRNPSIELPENLMLLEKQNARKLMNPVVFDYFWRLFRNLPVNNIAEIVEHYPNYTPDSRLNFMISIQQKTSKKILNIGILSKLLMLSTYLVVCAKWGVRRQ